MIERTTGWIHRRAADAPEACANCKTPLLSGAKVHRDEDGTTLCRACGKDAVSQAAEVAEAANA